MKTAVSAFQSHGICIPGDNPNSAPKPANRPIAGNGEGIYNNGKAPQTPLPISYSLENGSRLLSITLSLHSGADSCLLVNLSLRTEGTHTFRGRLSSFLQLAEDKGEWRTALEETLDYHCKMVVRVFPDRVLLDARRANRVGKQVAKQFIMLNPGEWGWAVSIIRNWRDMA